MTKALGAADVHPIGGAPGIDADIDVDIDIEAAGWGAVLGDDFEGAVSAVVQAALRDGGLTRAAEVGIRFTDDATVRQLNRDYRGRDKATNVLSFALSEAGEASESAEPGSPPLMLGDLVLGLETVLVESEGQQKAPSDHTYHLLIHGALHLMGYDHQTKAEADRMESLETRLCARFGIADPYADPPPAVPNSGT